MIFAAVRSRLESVCRFCEDVQLRTKLLLSLVLVTATLTGATLLVVRDSARSQVQREIEDDTRDAFLTIQAVQHQHELIMRRKADLLAMLAYMRGGDPSSIKDASEDPWQSSDCDLFALADKRGKVLALHSKDLRFVAADAEALLQNSLTSGNRSGWWAPNGRVFQVVFEPFYEDQLKTHLQGTVIVGHELGGRDATDLARISSSHLVLRSGNDVVISTLPIAQTLDLPVGLANASKGEAIALGGERFYSKSVVLASDQRPITLTVFKSYDKALASLVRLNHMLLGLGFAAIFVGGILVFALADRFARPLSTLAEGVRALEQGDYSYPLDAPARGGDEVAQVTRAFQDMRSTLRANETQKQELEGQLRQAQKMDAMGRLAGGVAHDFNNLLTVIKGNTCCLTDQLGANPNLLRFTSQIDGAADRAVSLTRQLLAFCRMQVLQPKVLDLNQLVSEMCKLLRRLVREDIAFTFHGGEGLGRVKADPGQIEQVIMNLVVNAGDAMPTGGSLTIETQNVNVKKGSARRQPFRPGDYVLLSVTDTGEGMKPETKARIFEPFFTTKEQGKGTGLGLATVYGIVKQSGGFIWVESEVGQGARFEIYLPIVDQEIERTLPQTAPTGRANEPKQTVLIVEDEDAVRELACEFLKACGYEVLTARDGKEALAAAARADAAIDLVLTDVVMPKMRGPDLVKKLRTQRPNLRVIYMTGYLEYNRSSEEFVSDALFIQKPFTRETLIAQVREALERDLVPT